jgi:hypothetical protein
MFTLHELDKIDKSVGFLIGTTNQLLLNFPKSRADLIINLDTEKIDYPNEKALHVKTCKTHTNYEKKLLAHILKSVNIDYDESSNSKSKQSS